MHNTLTSHYLSYSWKALLIILLIMQLRLWVGENSLAEAWSLKTRIESQQAANKLSVKRNKIIDDLVIELKTTPKVLEEYARYDLGFIKRNETFYQLLQ